jgi:hypothetical protein
VELEHARQLLGPAAEQLEQLASHAWHAPEVVSKNWFLLHVGRQRPPVDTGRFAGQAVHWLKASPEQLAQSGWQVRHWPADENVPEGQVEIHLPLEASWLLGHVRQKVDEPPHVVQEESQAIEFQSANYGKRVEGLDLRIQVVLSWEDIVLPAGHESTQTPLLRKNPGRHCVHCFWSTVDATPKLGILH